MSADNRLGHDGHGYATFTPRPDDEELEDQQSSFYDSLHSGCSIVLGGNGSGCLGAEQAVFDPVVNDFRCVSKIGKPFHIYARNADGVKVVARADTPKIYGRAALYEFTLSNGQSFISTLHHRALASSRSYIPLQAIVCGFGGLFQSDLRPRVCDAQKHAERGIHTVQDSLGDCRPDLRSCGEQPLLVSDIGQSVIPLPADVPARNLLSSRADVRRRESDDIHRYPHERRLSMLRCDALEPQSFEASSTSSYSCSRSFDRTDIPRQHDAANNTESNLTPSHQRFPVTSFHHCDTNTASTASATVSLFSSLLSSGENDSPVTIVQMRFLRVDDYWDFHVPQFENYELCGTWHHNTTTLTVAKACRFLLETPPPRIDTPFWFLASSYDQATKVLFKEKIWLGGLIPSEMFDWARADWYKVKQTLPYAMPLKKHENGNNWMMQFLSYEQSVGQMMAQATAGFMFCEQFDWIILEEVLRGTREYSFKGNKLIEFTPVKPELSIQLEEMIENGEAPENVADRVPGAKYLPKDWGVYYCNTEASLKHGQVDPEWYESFFAMIPDEMRAVRQKGRFASYEGVIYSGFSPHLHVIGDEIWRMMDGAYHRRGIDWGAGPHNPFAAVWGARTPDGQWLIYDEYESANQEFGTVEHLCEVQQRWEWPRSSLFYGTSWADPARPENLRMAAKLPQYVQGREDADDYDFMVIHRARNAVQEGIEHVRYLLKPTLTLTDPSTGERVKRPRMLIHRSCKKLIRCLRTYRWKKDSYSLGAANPEHARPEPLKLNDHLCDALRYMCLSEDASLGATIETANQRRPDSGGMIPDVGTSDRFAHRKNRR